MKILGIDPGTHRIGYGLILRKSDLKPLDYGVIEIQEGSIIIAAEQFQKLLEKLKPNLVAVEKLFFSKNRKTALAVAQTRGILILKILENKIPLVEYGPMEVKQAVTGYGLSDKKAVSFMVKRFLNMQEISGYDDASDALAIAITAANQLDLTEKIAKI